MSNRFVPSDQKTEVYLNTKRSFIQEAFLDDVYGQHLSHKKGTENGYNVHEHLRKPLKRHHLEDEKQTNERETKSEKSAFREEVKRELYEAINRIKHKHGKEAPESKETLERKALANSKLGFGHHGIHKGRENAAWAPRQANESAKDYANRVVKMWMKSPGHRANLLANSNEMGIGISGSTITLALA